MDQVTVIGIAVLHLKVKLGEAAPLYTDEAKKLPRRERHFKQVKLDNMSKGADMLKLVGTGAADFPSNPLVC